MAKTQALEKTKGDTIRELLDNPVVKKQIQMAIPKHLTVDRLLRTTMTAIRTNPKLLECTQKSLLAAVMGCAQLGLEPEPFLGQAYLVPFRRKVDDKFVLEATLIPGYRGYIALARRSGEVQTVSSHVVHEKDRFEFEFGLNEKLVHIPYQPQEDGETAGAPLGAYVVFKYKDGSHSMDYMTTSEILAIARRSKTYDPIKDKKGEVVKDHWSGPWESDIEEMMKKTVIKRHIKLAPLSVEIQKAAHFEDKALFGENQFDTTFPELPETTETETKTFEELIKDKDIKDLDKFILEIAKGNNSTPEKVKEDATKDFDNFWAIFQKWGKKKPALVEKKKNETNELASTNEVAKDLLKTTTEKPPEDPLSKECPDTGDRYKRSYCREKCQGFSGCPAWPDESQTA